MATTKRSGAAQDGQSASQQISNRIEGNVRRVIDIRQDEEIDGPALKALIRAPAALNAAGGKKG